ncbi:MAG: hypothetical protein CO077_01230 [Candidatus Nealsonbacteria bacterium CG_4_9_14_0_8_um_filter_35_12]|uniref:Clp ATPase C-terminal domain-containing protein n=1 Tax=Candidatus Nealsonbacteria bacterium CG_4_9_14_0_8_um_filter_35_12 TaxID=1974692 RepID=A0A2M8DN45_9BACT|nr:MAG: hypothetical protein CO077_01230 [Candidatus Nealsonbacteria bacterium CG_4_9_14_0_8_um_filter_35_12]
MPEEIFKNFPEPEKELSPETEILIPKPKTSIKKFLLPLIILIILVLITGISFYFYSKVKPDPISLLPKETTFYLKIKINPEDQQVKNLKELLNRFPYYEKISQKIGEEFRKWKEETPALKNLDFTISNELILAIISPLDENSEEIPLVLILPNPDLKKAEVQKDIEFVITLPLKEKIVELGYSPIFGAREIRRVIQDKVENPLAQAILAEKLKRRDRVEIDPEEFKLRINP